MHSFWMIKYYMILVILIFKNLHTIHYYWQSSNEVFFLGGGAGEGGLWIDIWWRKIKGRNSKDIYILLSSVCHIHTIHCSVFLVALKPFKGREDLHLTVLEGLNINLPCEPPASNPPATILFLVNGSSVISGKSGELNEIPQVYD